MTSSKSKEQRKERKRGYQVVETDALRRHLGRNDYAAVEELRAMSERFDAINQSKAALSADKRAGFVAEEYIAGTFNHAARKKGQMTLTAKTGSNGGFPLDQRADINVVLDGKVVAEAQAKFGANARRNAVAISKPQYRGTQRVVPSEQASCIKTDLAASASKKASSGNPRMRQIGADRMEAAANTTDRLRACGTESKPLSHPEAMKLATGKTAKLKVQIEGELLAASALHGAKSGALLGGACSAVTQSIAVATGKKGIKEAASEVIADTAAGAAKAAVTSVTAEGVKLAAKSALPRSAAKTLIKGSAPLAVAGCAIEMATDAIKGDLTPRRAAHHTATAAGGWAGAEAGALAGSFFGPVGTVAGGLIGGVIGSFMGGSLFD